eukprot:9479941-Pyramimonas_sp.AAC.1
MVSRSKSKSTSSSPSRTRVTYGCLRQLALHLYFRPPGNVSIFSKSISKERVMGGRPLLLDSA